MFVPTHTITLKDKTAGKRRTIKVMEVEGGLYTKKEWKGEIAPDWSFNDDRSLSFMGQVCPAGHTATIKRTCGFKVGDLVTAGTGEDRDTGRVVKVVQDRVTVAWDTLVQTECVASLLTKI